MHDLIDRQAAIDALDVLCQEHRYKIPGKRETYSPYNEAWQDALGRVENAIGNLPSAQPERDIPIKPKETTDRTWGIQSRQAVCPKCDYYLSNFVFLGDGKGKRVTYCEHCGQAIDWEGWDVDE